MTLPLSSALSLPSALAGRDAGVNAPAETQRLTLPRQAETVRAPRPVDPANRPADSKLPTARDRPVGPPPAFAITLLQHLRETALDPPDRPPPAVPGGEGGGDDPVEASATADPKASTPVDEGRGMRVAEGAGDSGPHRVSGEQTGAVDQGTAKANAPPAAMDVRY